MNRKYFNQADLRWANHPYPANADGYRDKTIKTSGCGPTSGAMIVSNLTNETITPDKIGDLFINNGYRVAGGTLGSAFPFIAKKYGLVCNVKVKLDDAISCLNRGGMVVANVRGGSVFSTGGHYIVLAYMENSNTIAVFDPYMYNGKFNTSFRKNKVTVSGNTVYISYQNMKDYGNYSNLYCFEPVEKSKNETYKNGDIIEIDTPIYFTGAMQNNTYLYDTICEQKWLSFNTQTLIKDNKLHARATYVWNEGEVSLIQVFDDQFRIKTKYIINKL